MKIYEDNAPEYTYCSVWLCNLCLSWTDFNGMINDLNPMAVLR